MAGTTTVTGAGRTITVVPTLPLAPEALVEVFVTRDVQDVASNALSPSNDATAVPTNGVIEVEYSEPLDPASLVLGAVTLRQEFGALAEVPSAVTLVRGGRVIRVEPATPLAATASYAVEVTTAVRDLDGVAPAAGLVSRFTTGAGDDLVTPTVVGVTPPDGAIGVGVNASLRVRFDEPVNPLTVTGATILVSDGVTAAVACTISFGAGDREVVVVPHGPLTAAAVHQVTIAGVEDLAGNPVVVRTTQFTTGTGPDTNAPTALRLAPTGTGVPITVAIEVELDEPIDPIALNSDTFQVIDTVTDLAVAGSAAVNASGSTISFVPDAPLAVGHRHSVRLSGIADVAGNIAGTISFTFTTGTAADTTGPQVVAVSPADGLADVPINARVVVAFDDPIRTPTAAQVSLSAAGGAIAVSRSLSDGNRTLTLTPLLPLAALSEQTVSIAGVADLGGIRWPFRSRRALRRRPVSISRARPSPRSSRQAARPGWRRTRPFACSSASRSIR